MAVNIRKSIPWYIKFIIKIIRGSLPIPYDFYAKLGLFRHGRMDNPDYAINIFENHFPATIQLPKSSFTFLEIGPGDSLASGIIASSKGAKRSYLIDQGDYMTKDTTKYFPLIEKIYGAEFLKNKKFKTIEDIKREFNIIQMTEGVTSLKTLPDKVIDLSFSNACLEHVDYNEIEEYFTELRRVCKPGSISSHFIDFKDHLGYSLNNLRFTKKIWEKDLIKKAGVYTNRMRFFEMKSIIEKIGFKCSVIDLRKWEVLPLSKSKLHSDFRNLKEEDLLIKEALIRLTLE